MKKKYFILLLALFFVCPFFVQAVLAPQIYFTDLSISKTGYSPSETINGIVSLWNYESAMVSDLVLDFQLLGDKVNGVPTKLIDEKRDQSMFSLSGGQKLNKSFSYVLPVNLPNGSFIFRVQLLNSRGEEMSWKDKDIIIGGEGKFLDLDNYWIIEDGEELPAGMGVNYDSGEIPQVSFEVSNNSQSIIDAYYKIITYERNVGQILQEDKKENINLNSGEKKKIKTSLPRLTTANTYLSEIRFYDDNEEPVSNSIFFRWVVIGNDDASILYVNPNKDSYEAGESIEINVQYTGPAHTEAELNESEKGLIEVKIIDKDGSLACQTSQEIDLKTEEVLIDCLVENEIENPIIDVAITKDGQLLDEYSYEVASAEEKAVKKETGVEKRWYYYIVLISVAIIFIIGSLIYMLTNKYAHK